jgi:iron(III) transport system ATP-binding protein
VALARALVGEPKLVLFDEPLSNLDAKLREHMRVELTALQDRLGFTAIYVTHDQTEALALSDQLIIMNGGVIEQQGTPTAIYRTPMTPFVADFMGASNFLEGKVLTLKGDHYVTVELREGEAPLTCRRQSDQVKQGAPMILSFRPDNTGLVPVDRERASTGHPEEVNRVPGRVKTVMFLGECFEYEVEVGKSRIKSRVRSTEPVPPETPVFILLAPDHCVAILAQDPSHPSS